MTLAFDASEYASRVERAQRAVTEAGLDALIVTAPENTRYLSGFAMSGYHVFQALVVRRAGAAFLVVRNIEIDNVKAHPSVERSYPIDNLDTTLPIFADAVKAERADRGRIGVEVDGARQSITRLDLLVELLPDAAFCPSLGMVDACERIARAIAVLSGS